MNLRRAPIVITVGRPSRQMGSQMGQVKARTKFISQKTPKITLKPERARVRFSPISKHRMARRAMYKMIVRRVLLLRTALGHPARIGPV